MRRNKYSYYLKVFVSIGIFTAIILICFQLNFERHLYAIPKEVTAVHNPGPSHFEAETQFSHPLLNKPDSLFSKGEYDRAGYFYNKAAALFLKDKNWKSYIWAINHEAYSCIKNNDFTASHKLLLKALKCGRKNLGKEHAYVGETYYILGEYYYAIKEPQRSLQALDTAVHISKLSFGLKSKHVAYTYELMGRVQLRLLNNYTIANAYLDTAFMLIEKLSENDTSYLYNYYYDVAAANYYKEDYDKGMMYSYECLNIAQSLHNFPYIEKAHALLAVFYYAKFDVSSTIYHLEHAITLNKNSNRKRDLVNYYNNLGNAFIEKKQFEEAKKNFKNALKIVLENNKPDSSEISNSYASIGDIYQQLNIIDSSLFNYKQCLKIRLTHFGKKHYKTSLAYQDIGSLFQQFHQTDSALTYFQLAITAGISNSEEKDITVNIHAATIGNSYYLYETFAQKALALQEKYLQSGKIQYLHQAFANYQLADTLMFGYIHTLDLEESKLQLYKKCKSVYEKALECVYLLTKVEKNDSLYQYAFNYIERSKSQLLLQALLKAESFHATGVPDSLIYEEKKLQLQWNTHQQKLEQLASDFKTKQISEEAIRSQLFLVEKDQEKLKKTLNKNYPSYVEFKYINETVSLKDVQAYCDSNNTNMIQYFRGDSAIYVISFALTKTAFIKVPRTREFDQVLTAFTESFSTVSTPGLKSNYLHDQKNEFTQYIKCAHYLYNSLLKPVISELYTKGLSESSPKLVIIPDGPLAYLPFNALISKLPSSDEINYRDLHYLINDFKISTAFSVNLLLRNKNQKTYTIKPLVLGFGYSDATVYSNTNNKNETTQEIPGSGRELQYIKDITGGKFFTGANATKKNFITYAPDYFILHLAVHGKASEESQYGSRLIFKTTKKDSLDCHLYSYELYSLKLQARLVVLSACQTGRGKDLTGEGIYSIARGFAYAGCPSTVMSLWKVDDIATADLMKTFYQGLSVGLPIDESLQKAQIHFLQTADELSSHPRYWAAFLPSGDMTPVYPNAHLSNTEIGIITLFSVSLLLLFIIYKRPLFLHVHKKSKAS